MPKRTKMMLRNPPSMGTHMKPRKSNTSRSVVAICAKDGEEKMEGVLYKLQITTGKKL